VPRIEENKMKPANLALLAVSLFAAGASTAEAASATASGSAALALAGVVAPCSPLLSAGEKKAVAAFFAGDANFATSKKISVTADKIVCRISDVDITARSCELTFKTTTHTVTGRKANEIYATEVFAGVPSDGAAGSIFESLSKLTCTLDPKELKDKAGGGATCSFDTGN
jgi:hypothetical protein